MSDERPVALDLCVGLGGWVEGLTAEGWHVIGIDIEDMFAAIGEPKPPNFELVVQSIMDTNGADYAHVGLIVASPPCQFFSYCAMPWSLAKERAARTRADPELLAKELVLFKTCFRIQREASEAAGRHIPMVLENVRGAQPWVGRAAFNFGSYYLWGDVPALMPKPIDARKVPGFRFDGSGASFQTAAVNQFEGLVPNEDSKTKGMNWSDRSLRGQDFTRIGGLQTQAADGVKVQSLTGRSPAPGQGARFTSRDCGAEGQKVKGDWFAACDIKDAPRQKSGSARKAASAKIAKIPLALSTHIARVYRP